MRVLTAIVLSCLLGCASASARDEGQSCQLVSNRLSAIKIDRDTLRDQKKSNADVQAILGRGGYKLTDAQVTSLRGYVRKECGGTNNGLLGSLKEFGDERQGNEYATSETAETLNMLEQQHKMGVRSHSSDEMQSKVSKVNVDAVFEDETKYEYPSLAGEMKADAQAKRKTFLQKRVVADLVSNGALLAAFHQGLQERLLTKVMMPLSGAEAKTAESRTSKTLAEYDIDDQLRDSVIRAVEKGFNEQGLTCVAITSEHKTPSETSGTSRDLKMQTYDEEAAVAAYFKDVTEFYPFTYASTQEIDDGEHYQSSKEQLLGKLIKSRALRTKMLAALIISETKVTAQRLDEKHFVIKVRTDFPELFRKYPFVEISKFVEH